jgi:pyruvate/2-oxoglutarate dehydrogenase complex dihydrolipoamide acyltransferase (E2) component
MTPQSVLDIFHASIRVGRTLVGPHFVPVTTTPDHTLMRAPTMVGWHHEGYEVVLFPKLRRALAVMSGSVKRAHQIHGLIEVDVTEARRHLREHEKQTKEALSFTAFITNCVAHAVAENKSLNACRKGGKQLVLFDDVDVATLIERDIEGHKQPIVYCIRGANRKGVREITHEIRTAQVAAVEATWEGFQAERWLMRVPLFALQGLWAIFWWLRGRSPQVQKKFGGTVGLTAVGMFGKGGGWGIPLAYHTLDITLGGIAEKPGVVEGRIAIREYLCMTLSFDHDVIDGAPAARFVSRLRELIERSYGLREGEEELVTDGPLDGPPTPLRRPL